MQAKELFSVWAPETSVWAAWAKPVLFAHIQQSKSDLGVPQPVTMDVSWSPSPTSGSALVVNLPGVASVEMGLALAERGYRPVPLYNTSVNSRSVIEVEGIVSALVRGTALLQQLSLPDDAPPAFLLDAGRMRGKLPTPGMFDNRWIVFPQDFPSANYLRSKHIERIIVVQPGSFPDEDLAIVLNRWQKDGLDVQIVTHGTDNTISGSVPYQRSQVREFLMWTRIALLGALGLRRNMIGGFGGFIPYPSSGGS
jgi:hypothetical protein